MEYLDLEVLQEIGHDLRNSELPIDRFLANYLTNYESLSLQAPPLAVLGAILTPQAVYPREDSSTHRSYLAFSPGLPNPKVWGVGFLIAFLSELREIICKKRNRNKLSDYTQSLIAGIATFLTSKLALPSGTAAALAVLILLSLAKASKKAFCDMTDKEVIEALSKESR